MLHLNVLLLQPRTHWKLLFACSAMQRLLFALAAALLVCHATAIDNTQDRACLTKFAAAFSSQNWRVNTGWLSAASMCDWFGVTCETTAQNVSYVTELSLSGNNLVSRSDLPALSVGSRSAPWILRC